jgi:unsaturated rhamnogalacturonyl hydrolase
MIAAGTANGLADPGGRVVLDCHFNNEWKRDSAGSAVRFHYVWTDTTDSGFSQLAAIILGIGGEIDTLPSRPTAQALRDAAVYIIVDPDTPRETAAPNVLDEAAAAEILGWVRSGGVLLLLGNDSVNADLGQLNRVAARTGIRFNEDTRNRVAGRQYETGTFERLPAHPVFAGVRRLFLKEVCTLTLSAPAEPILVENEDVIMAASRYGAGAVVAIGDPWLYNEYMDGRRLPAGYDNAVAGKNLFTWIFGLAGRRGEQ